jgi:hypothetical protein
LGKRKKVPRPYYVQTHSRPSEVALAVLLGATANTAGEVVLELVKHWLST